MAEQRQMGIPDIKQRLDGTEEAREWNKMREAVLSLYNSRIDPPVLPRVVSRLHGFEPISIGDGGVDGIGLHPGPVHLIRVPRFDTASTENEEEEIWPTLGGTTLNTDPAPRSALADGDWEAWCIVQEREEDESLARIVFRALGTGAGTLRRDEKATRLCSFAVVSNQITEVYEQLIIGDLPIKIDHHQWRCVKTGDTTFNVIGGNAVALLGTQPDWVGSNVACPDSGNLTISGAGSIWIQFYVDFEQHSQDLSVVSGSATYTLTNYRIKSLAFTAYSQGTPAQGADATSHHYAGSGSVWYELAQVTLEDGQAQVTRQLISDTIFVNELHDTYFKEGGAPS